YLESLAVSRQHARIVSDHGTYFVEDVGSSNGTYLNGHRINGRVPLTDRDTLQIGPYELNLLVDPTAGHAETQQVIRARVEAAPSNHPLSPVNAGPKPQVVLQIAQALGPPLDPDPLLGKLLAPLLRLFPQADRGMALLLEAERGPAKPPP